MRGLRTLIAAAALASAQLSAGPDLVIFNARAFTGDRASPWAEAIAVRGNRITAVGSTSTVRRTATSSTRLLDAAGRLLIPGINDAHLHLGGGPPSVQLEGPPAMEHDPALNEIVVRVQIAAVKAPRREWLVGEIGPAVLADPHANRTTLDRVSDGHPVFLRSWTGHGVVVNTAALRALSVREDEHDPAGGRFLRAADGRTLTGVAEEYAGFLLSRRLAMLAERSARRLAIERLAQELATFGVTSAQVMMNEYPTADTSALLSTSALPVRVRLIDFPFVAMADWRQVAPRRAEAAGSLITISGTKWVLDGTPLERLMRLRAPYADAPDTSGRPNFSDENLRRFLRKALEAREQPLLHAGGDAAIPAVLDALEATGGNRWKPLRPRIEHGDMTGAVDLPRMARMGVTVVQNPSHFMIADVVRTRLGATRAGRMGRVKDIVAAGVPLAIGSDGPINPFLNIMFATMNAANPPQALTVEQALTAYTAGSAAAEFAEGQKGMLKVGMLADFALLSQDVFVAPPADLPKTTSVLTVVNGKVVDDRLSR